MKTVISSAICAVLIFPSIVIGLAPDHKTACVQKKFHGLVETTYWSHCTDEFWNASGKKRDAFNDFEKDAIIFYAEFGITNCDTISAKSAWVRIEESINGRGFGVEDAEIGWKHSFGKVCNHYLSAELVGIIPTETEHKPGLRYGQYGGEANLLLTRGFTWWDRCGSYDVRLGYRAYEGYPSDQIRSDFILNYFVFPRLKISASGQLEYGLFNGSSRTDESLFLLNPNYRLFRGQIQALLCLYKGISGFVGYQRHLWGRNVGTGGGVYGGAQWQF